MRFQKSRVLGLPEPPGLPPISMTADSLASFKPVAPGMYRIEFVTRTKREARTACLNPLLVGAIARLQQAGRARQSSSAERGLDQSGVPQALPTPPPLAPRGYFDLDFLPPEAPFRGVRCL